MNYWILLLVSLLFSAVGFYMYIYFFSVGYGLSVAAIGVTLAILFAGEWNLGEMLCSLMLVIYGLRLAGYLLIREWKSAAYSKVLRPEMERSKKMPFGPKLAIWISCALLYTLETSPVLFRMQNDAPADWALWLGLGLMVFGFTFELAADLQKTKAKKVNAYRFVDTGLYRIVRCPNYLGEMIFWLGVLVSGITALSGVWQWIAALLGFVLIVYVMFSGARRLEIRQDRNYGEDPAYQAYCKKVPILIPLLPLYSVKKYKFLSA